METALKKLRESEWLKGWVLYDVDCPSCRRFARLTEDLLTRRGFDVAPLQSAFVRECLGELGPEPFKALRVITVNGESFSGADGLIFLAGCIWWAWPLAGVALIPGVRALLRRAYGYYASHRCMGQCDKNLALAQRRNPVTPSVPLLAAESGTDGQAVVRCGTGSARISRSV